MTVATLGGGEAVGGHLAKACEVKLLVTYVSHWSVGKGRCTSPLSSQTSGSSRGKSLSPESCFPHCQSGF